MEQSIGSVSSTATTQARVIPLLQSLSRVETIASELSLRLDPIVQHVPMKDGQNTPLPSISVTTRINTLGDTLQYLLDNIEL